MVRASEERRILKRNEKAAKKRQLQSSASSVYDRLIQIFSDFQHQRRGLRLGFHRWLQVLGMQSKQHVATASRAQTPTQPAQAAAPESVGAVHEDGEDKPPISDAL